MQDCWGGEEGLGEEVSFESARMFSGEKTAIWEEAAARLKAQKTENNSQLCGRR